ncbi:preprotein translocase subunit SecE [Candidatus Kaiserbacteria bacterium CG10_big_fil_rev_8_21_14_0_10_49_17]|uniref:Protein translocase subunit SecE n=1 Tax=Candidatus Kaiserbacteria bacterium CG10_big_fil_rev_8_21_14_0_10_49_17 TaxID=1974609 RepID=A0A2M6WDM1_9BACT|nr:MAG: preprotein translocase subunit SecE [Candidatus Kaiserbacteria bacterium CG10_big_fil_rev_8_21_14_0_10_49_17]
MSKFIQYLRDTRGELRHVSWPTQKQTIVFTALVIAISILTAIYLGVFDFFFTKGISLFI